MSSRLRKIDFEKLREVVEPQNELVLRQILSSQDFNGSISITWVAIDGEHQSLISHSQLRVYLIMGGNVTFTVNQIDTYTLKKNDVLTLNAGDSYSLRGSGEYVVMNLPAFTAGDDEYVTDK